MALVPTSDSIRHNIEHRGRIKKGGKPTLQRANLELENVFLVDYPPTSENNRTRRTLHSLAPIGIVLRVANKFGVYPV